MEGKGESGAKGWGGGSYSKSQEGGSPREREGAGEEVSVGNILFGAEGFFVWKIDREGQLPGHPAVQAYMALKVDIWPPLSP